VCTGHGVHTTSLNTTKVLDKEVPVNRLRQNGSASYIHILVCVHEKLNVHKHELEHVHENFFNTYINIYTNVYVSICMIKHMNLCMNMNITMFIFIFLYMYMEYIFIYIFKFILMYMYSYIDV
jgi:hypothetical protein